MRFGQRWPLGLERLRIRDLGVDRRATPMPASRNRLPLTIPDLGLRPKTRALEIIAERGCEHFTTGPGSCWRSGRVMPSEDSGGTCYEACYGCVAFAALKSWKGRVMVLVPCEAET